MNARVSIAQRPLIAAAVAAVILCALADVGLYWRMTAARRSVARQEKLLSEMRTIAEQWKRIQSSTGAAQATLPAGVSLDPQTVRDVAGKSGVGAAITSIKVRTARVSERLQEQLVSLSLINVTRRDLSNFLYAVESVAPAAVRTKSVDYTTSPQQAGLVNANVEFSAYAVSVETQ